MNLVKMIMLSMSSRSSVDRAPARCSGGHGFDSCRGLRLFLFHVRAMLVQSLNFSFFQPYKGAEPGRAKEESRESRITCMRMLRTNQ